MPRPHYCHLPNLMFEPYQPNVRTESTEMKRNRMSELGPVLGTAGSNQKYDCGAPTLYSKIYGVGLRNVFHKKNTYKPTNRLDQWFTTGQKCIICSNVLKIRGQNFQQNLPENCSKSTKLAITVCKFSNVFRGACPRTP